jgi:hypothetical protein
MPGPFGVLCSPAAEYPIRCHMGEHTNGEAMSVCSPRAAQARPVRTGTRPSARAAVFEMAACVAC